jgi:hypothetical protein
VRAILAGLCLLLAMQTGAAADVERATAAAAAPSTEKVTKAQRKTKVQRKTARSYSLGHRIAHVKRAIHRSRSTIRFFDNHPRLLATAKHRPPGRAVLRSARRRLSRSTHALAVLERAVARRNARRLARRLAKAPPRAAICHVFGRRYCREALTVSWCESRHSTTAQNGQYLGLFQMGSWERQLFGHGATAHEQAAAAHRYFVLSGRDWSPWGCKPW